MKSMFDRRVTPIVCLSALHVVHGFSVPLSQMRCNSNEFRSLRYDFYEKNTKKGLHPTWRPNLLLMVATADIETDYLLARPDVETELIEQTFEWKPYELDQIKLIQSGVDLNKISIKGYQSDNYDSERYVTKKTANKKKKILKVRPATNTEKRIQTLRKTDGNKITLANAVSKRKRRTATGKKSNVKISSRSSTMPGFGPNYQNSARVKSYEDGLKIVEAETGRDIRNHRNVLSRRVLDRKANAEDMYAKSASVPNSLMLFTDEIHKVERITPAQELELGTKTQEAMHIQNVYEKLKEKLKREPSDAEYCAAAGKMNMEALKQAIDDGMKAKNQLVTSNLRMVQGVVNLYIRNGLGSQYNAGDMMQDGIIALIRAAEKYEPQRGFRFSTYAMYWIRSSIKRSQVVQSRVIGVPQRLYEDYKKIKMFRKEFEDKYNRQPSYKELAELVEKTEEQVERCVISMEQEIYSMDAELTNPLREGAGRSNSGKKTSLSETISNQDDPTGSEDLEQRFFKDDLIDSLRQHLQPIEVDLIMLRYGLMDEKTSFYGFTGPLTISEVSTLVGYKPDKVRRMLNKSLDKLKMLIADWESRQI